MVTCQELQDDLLSSEICVTEWIISYEIHRNDLKSRFPQKTPLLLKKYRDARKKFLCEHKDKGKSYWERVLWTDETKSELFGLYSRNHV